MAFLTHSIVRMQCNVFKNAVEKEYKLSEFGNSCPLEIKGGLEKLMQEIEKLEATWSDMAGRNIMNDIVRQLVTLEPNLKGDSKAAAIGVKNNITRALGGYTATNRRYKSVVCLGYKVKTGFAEGYKGRTEDRDDMVAKAADLLKAIQAAHANLPAQYQTEPTMLKVFMAPEFYFRGKNGGYSFADVNGGKDEKGVVNKSLVEILRAELDNDKYKDWLFVLGTVIVISKDMKTVCTQCAGPVQFTRKDPKSHTAPPGPVCSADPAHVLSEEVVGAQVDNIALIIKEKYVHTVAKELVSHIDYQVRPGEANKYKVLMDGGNEVSVSTHPTAGGMKAANEGKTRFQDERMGGCIFTIDGITIGCEVCLDHAASAGSKTEGRLDHADNIQIHLLPSGGMSAKKLRTVPLGTIFNVDGLTPHVAAFGFSTVFKEVEVSRSDGKGSGTGLIDSWDEMEKLLKADVLKSSGNYPDKDNQAAAAGPAGPVLRYGPFQIPDA